MARLIDADELAKEFRNMAEIDAYKNNSTWWAEMFKSVAGMVDETPSVSANTAMQYYYEQRDREYAERMDDIWKSM